MSGKATGDAFDRSPLTGQEFTVHLAIADAVGDLYEYRFWMKRENLAKKARVSRATVDRAIRELVATSWLEVVEEGGGRGKATEYRYNVGGIPRQGEGVSPVTASDTASPEADTASGGRAHPITNGRTVPNAEKVRKIKGAVREPDLLFESLVEVCQYVLSELTPNQRGKVNAAAKQLRAVGATPEQVRARGAQYKVKMPGAVLTPNALANHWAGLGVQAPSSRQPDFYDPSSDPTLKANRLVREEGQTEDGAVVAG